MDPGQKAEPTMTTTLPTLRAYTEPRFVIVNARGEFADDLGADPIFATEAAAEEAIESLTASGFDLDGYSARELTTNDLVGDERDAMLAACRAEGREAAQQERAECGELAAWSDFLGMTPSWDALKAMLLARFGVELYRGRFDEAVDAYRDGRESVVGNDAPAEAPADEATYSVTFRGARTVDAYSATEGADDNDGLTLTETRERCEAYGVSAELRDVAGFVRGFVSADGSYTLA
jgi:hypothetical protein